MYNPTEGNKNMEVDIRTKHTDRLAVGSVVEQHASTLHTPKSCTKEQRNAYQSICNTLGVKYHNNLCFIWGRYCI